ncbi:UNVERIFIED_CONTAM: hypothetical protein GTU68_015916, partial [Idotea baltica]|nr:hypothetical protein [Idotea baltica]
DGSCVDPVVKRNVFDYDAPQEQVQEGPPPQITNPKKTYVVIARAPDSPEIPAPPIFPSSQHKARVYVLSKKGQIQQQVIDVPPGPNPNPEVYFLYYNDEGDNPQLPGRFDL